jgi:hypothetical protein
MKNLIKIFLAFMLFVTFSASAGVSNMLSNFGNTIDTVVNTGTAYVDITVNGVYEVSSFQAVITKISGTVGGTVILQGSLDGTNFNAVGADTLVPTDVTTNSHVFVNLHSPYKYYRLLITGTGTMSAKISGKAFLNPSSSGRHDMFNMLDAQGGQDDTIANTATGYVGYTVNNYYERVAIQAVVTKLSGTAAGTVTLQGSIDGTNYVTVKAAYVSSSATLTVTNVTTTSKIFVVSNSPYNYYRLSYTGSGTMSCKINGYLVPSK